MKHLLLAVALGMLVCVGCTSVKVRPVPSEPPIKSVSIRENPKVIVVDFLDILKEGFARHGISAMTIPPTANPKGEYVVDYVAYRKWDMAPYLVDATVRVEKDGELIGSAIYHLKGGGGLSPAKWNSAKSKMDPVLDELLKNYPLAAAHAAQK